MDPTLSEGGSRRIITTPSLRRGRDDFTPLNEKVKLERVLGLTVANNAGLDSDPNTGSVAYPAGCTVVVCGRGGRQSHHLINSSKKTITAVRFSPDGRYLATGECGHCPALRLWDLGTAGGGETGGGGGLQLAEMSAGHKYSINCLAFSPTQKYIVSLGSEHDMIVNVWDWRSGLKVASNKVSTKVKAVSFAENGTYFVTVGNRHVKFWYLDYHRGSKFKEPVPLMGRSAILGDQRNNDFVDVACGRGETADSTFAITRQGLLCEFNNRRLLDKWVELRTTSANCLSLGESRIFIGCAEGIVRCFDPRSLRFVTTLPRTHYLGVDVAQGLDISHMANHPQNAKYPDTIAVTYDEVNEKLTCVYNDHSLYIWDVRDIKRVGKSESYLYHSACIWGVEMFPEESPDVPPGSFLTCSSDDTIRVWSVDTRFKTSPESVYQRNIYSKELLKVIYIDPDLSNLKDTEGQGERGLESSSSSSAAYDGKNGVRSLRISPDGRHLASGDRAGNIRVHEVKSLEELCLIEAHDAEVLCLEYSRPESGHRLLASASRDRLVHVFDVSQGYNFLQTLDDHFSSITAVRFINSQPNLQMVSCGADKSVIFRQLNNASDGGVQFNRICNAVGKNTYYDMEVEISQKHVIAACQDRNIRVYNVNSGKHTKTFKGSLAEDGTLIKVALDASGIFVATSCTDKTLCIYDYYSSECMATMSGHSELVTGLKFSPDCSRLISASGDGCILVWSVPHDMVVTSQARLSQQQARVKRPTTTKLTNGTLNDNDETIENHIYDPNANHDSVLSEFSPLPLWAKKEGVATLGETNPSPSSLGSGGGPFRAKGKWATRVRQSPISIKSVKADESSRDFRLDSDEGKEDNSSVDSGAEVGRSFFTRRESHTRGQETSLEFRPCPESLNEIMEHDVKSMSPGGKITLLRGGEASEFHHQRAQTDDSSLGSLKYEDMESTEHDGDVEDCSEGESSDTRRPLYIPPHDEPNREFPITSIDSGELRKSVRQSKRPDLLMVTSEISSASRSVSGSPSDEDEETPTSDHAKHSIGSDSQDMISQREKYLKNTFESLSGAEESTVPVKKGKRSLSSQHQTQQVSGRNPAQAAAVLQQNSITIKSQRDELNRRIQETRRTLQSVGYKTSLKMSQSIQDLSLQGVYSSNSPVVGGGGALDGGGGGRGPKPVPRHRQLDQGNALSSTSVTSSPLRKPTPPPSTNTTERPLSLNLSQLSTNPYKSGSKSMDTSLTGSPIYDTNKLSPTNFIDNEMNMKYAAREAHRIKRYSCSFYVDINEKVIDPGRESKSYDDLNDIYNDNNCVNNDLSGSDYSSDSLEECSSYVPKPRRCVSEYQIIERTSSSAFCSRENKTKFHSEENILADDDQTDNWDRHSSASFFLRKTNCRSTESILTDESEYQYLFDNNREVCRSTESILTDGGDLKELSDDGLDEVPIKQTVSRTRSLQETTVNNVRSETPFSLSEIDNKKNESFFIPVGDGPKKPTPPSLLFKKYENKTDKKYNTLPHPVVAHKPPKPRMNYPSSRVKTAQKRIDKLLADSKKSEDVRKGLFRKDLWEAVPVRDPGLNSLPEDLPRYTVGRVKLLSQNFEKISSGVRCAGGGGDGGGVSCDSGSSTPGTSSNSATNSPKRKWKPSIGSQLARRIANGQLLPDKCPPAAAEEAMGSGGGIRRSCSLSDLSLSPSVGVVKLRNPVPAAQKKQTHTRHVSPPSNMQRSSSVGELNQSDLKSNVSLRVMRPTISSQNKVSASASSKAMAARRRGLSGAYSAIALNKDGGGSSSSEENQPPPSSSTKPAPPPRPKSMANLDRAGIRRGHGGIMRSGSEREIGRSSAKDVRSTPPLAAEVISTMAEQLQRAAESVAQLQSRLATAVDPLERDALLGGLTGAIGEAQRALGLVLPSVPPSQP